MLVQKQSSPILKSLLALSLVLGVSTYSFAQSSSSGSAQTMVTGVGTAVVSQMMIQKFMPMCSEHQTACVLAAAGVLGVTMAAGALGKDSSTNSAITDGGGFPTTTTPDGTTPGAGLSTDGALAAANNALNGLKPLGYNVDPGAGTITTPTGTYPASALGSGADMAAAGMISAADIGKVDAEIKALQDKFHITSMGIAGGGGGAGGGGSGKVKYEYTDETAGLYGRKLAIGATKTAGLTRSLASGESIGAQVDDIFQMIRREYQRKTDEKTFVGQ